MTASSSADKDQQVTLIEDFYGQRFYARQSNSSTDTKEACKKKKNSLQQLCKETRTRPGVSYLLAFGLQFFHPSTGGIRKGDPLAYPRPLEILQPSLLSWVSIFIFRDELCPGINYV